MRGQCKTTPRTTPASSKPHGWALAHVRSIARTCHEAPNLATCTCTCTCNAPHHTHSRCIQIFRPCLIRAAAPARDFFAFIIRPSISFKCVKSTALSPVSDRVSCSFKDDRGWEINSADLCTSLSPRRSWFVSENGPLLRGRPSWCGRRQRRC